MQTYYLTPKEYEIIVLVAEGLKSREIATRLSLSLRTVESHRYAAFGKMGKTRVVHLPALLKDERIKMCPFSRNDRKHSIAEALRDLEAPLTVHQIMVRFECSYWTPQNVRSILGWSRRIKSKN